MIRKLPTIVACLGLILATIVLASPGASAQSPTDNQTEGIAISPVRIKATYDAGTTQKDTVTVINDGETSYTFIVYARPYSVVGEKYDPNFQTVNQSTDAYRWIQFDKTSYKIEPHQRIEVPYTVNLPSSAAPGGHYAVIFAETQPADQNAGSVVRKKRVGAIVYATVNGSLQLSGSVLDTSIPFWQTKPPLAATQRIKNTGNTDFTSTVKLTVSDMFGNSKYSEQKEYPVLPQTTRLVTMSWSKAPWFGLYKAKLDSTVLGKTSSQSGYVLLLPRYIPAIIIVILIIGGVYAWFRRRKQ